MKTPSILITLLALAMTASGGALDQPTRVTIAGRVVQRTSEGLLVQTRRSGDSGQVWLRGIDAKEGKTITAPAVKVAPFEFLTAGGIVRMLDAYEVVR